MRIGIDIGGTKAEAIALGDDGRAVARIRRPSLRGADGVRQTVRTVLEDLSVRVPGGSIASIGIGIPGQIVAGRVLHAVNLDLEDVDLAHELAIEHAVPVRIENDVNAAALGAHALQTALAPDLATAPMAYLNLGTGVAAGYVLDGRLWTGHGGTAGEIGHLSIDPHGDVCPCGQRGCIETFAGGGAVLRRWSRGRGRHVGDVFDAADAGDPEARVLRERVVTGAAGAVRALVLSLDPASIVIGGGLARLGSRLLDAVHADLRRAASSSDFLRSLELDRRVALIPSDASPGAHGAALIAPARTGAARIPII